MSAGFSKLARLADVRREAATNDPSFGLEGNFSSNLNTATM